MFIVKSHYNQDVFSSRTFIVKVGSKEEMLKIKLEWINEQLKDIETITSNIHSINDALKNLIDHLLHNNTLGKYYQYRFHYEKGWIIGKEEDEDHPEYTVIEISCHEIILTKKGIRFNRFRGIEPIDELIVEEI